MRDELMLKSSFEESVARETGLEGKEMQRPKHSLRSARSSIIRALPCTLVHPSNQLSLMPFSLPSCALWKSLFQSEIQGGHHKAQQTRSFDAHLTDFCAALQVVLPSNYTSLKVQSADGVTHNVLTETDVSMLAAN